MSTFIAPWNCRQAQQQKQRAEKEKGVEIVKLFSLFMPPVSIVTRRD
jgi:hypothetical protein